MKAVYIEQTGGPEALKYGDMPKPEVAPGHALVKVAAAGVNFIDTYQRSGLYKLPLPAILGAEGAGTVEEGTLFKKGDRVAWSMSRGSYAEYAVVPESMMVALPDSVSFTDGAAALLQGMTAHYLACSTFPLKKGDTALIHAAAGGTGRLLVQIAKLAGARVIGTAGTEAKAQLARDAGADETIVYSTQDFVAETRRLTDGKGVDVVYDSVGASTLMKSLDCLRPRGMAVSFGHRAAPSPPSNLYYWSRKAPCISPVRRLPITSPIARNSSGAPPIFFAGSPRKKLPCGSITSTSWRTPRKRIAIWRVARLQGS
jgi:NADPH2:quinone reductase